jgi:hypothetical protein
VQTYAKALQSAVPSGSLTGGAVAKVKRFVGHIEDILRSVTESRHHLDEVAGEYAQAIRDHMAPIVGIVAGFIAAEAVSAFLAATPTGVGQAVAMVIQLALSAFGAAGMVEAGAQALEHGSRWLSTAWTAKGNEAKIVAASKEFLKMLVAIAMAALSFLGARGNYRNLVKIGGSMPTGSLPAVAMPGGRAPSGANAAAGVAIGAGPGPGAFGVGGALMGKYDAAGGGKKDKARSRKSDQAEPTAERTSKPVDWTAHGNKHVAPRNAEWSRVIESTRTGPAKYKPGTDIQALEREVWEVTGTDVSNGRPWKVQEFAGEIGASEGKPSRWVRVASSGNTIHGHPISEGEYLRLKKPKE